MEDDKLMSDPCATAAEWIADSDALLISASNGLSISEGLHIFDRGPGFEAKFPEIRERYGVSCILQGCMSRFPTEEEQWGFWSRLIGMHSIDYEPTPQMEALARISSRMPRFVITSNAEGHFTACGFPEEEVYEVEGNWRTMRCARGCCPDVLPSTEAVERMYRAEHDGVVPSELVPKCPRCGGPMVVNMVSDTLPFDDGGKGELFSGFVDRWRGRRLTVLELGIGSRNRLIKAPLMDLVYREPAFRYITVNRGDLYIPRAIADRSVGIDGDVADILERIEGLM